MGMGQWGSRGWGGTKNGVLGMGRKGSRRMDPLGPHCSAVLGESLGLRTGRGSPRTASGAGVFPIWQS